MPRRRIVDSESESLEGVGFLRPSAPPTLAASAQLLTLEKDCGSERPIGKKVNGVLTQGFLYRDALKPAAELDAAGYVVSRFVYGARSLVPDYLVKGGVTYRILSDQLGSPRLLIDVATGAIAQRLDYDEYGRILLDTNPGFQPFGFAGGLYDPQTGLVRFGARDYDPEVGRWTARDPIGFGGGDGNLFSYSGNNPVDLSDPTGRAVEWCHMVADLPGNFMGLEHWWLRTSTKEAGLGQAGGNVPAEGPYRVRDNSPFVTQTEIVDHTGRGRQPGAVCERLKPEVDEDCVNERLQIGSSEGRWSPFNQCQTFVLDIMEDCSKGRGE